MSGSKERDVMYDSNGREKNKIEAGVLYLVATPIGNLADLSERSARLPIGVATRYRTPSSILFFSLPFESYITSRSFDPLISLLPFQKFF